MTTTKKRVQARRAVNRRLGAIDHSNRCAFCRRQLPPSGVVIAIAADGTSERFCSDVCQQDQLDALQTLEARR